MKPLTTPRPTGRDFGTRVRRASARTCVLIASVTIVSTTVLVIPVGGGSATTRKIAPVFEPIANPPYPRGVPDSSEPSGQSPPAPDALPGYQESYVNDFNSSVKPTGWDIFTGLPGSDPGAHFGGSHVVFGGGLLRLLTYRNPKWHDRWVTGGLCQCGLARVYGAFFVRSKVSAVGPNEAELLWPVDNTWPPEIDFSETGGGIAQQSESVHFGATNHIDQELLRINMTQWHTWGVIWTPTSIIFTVDGQQWASDTRVSEIPKVPMDLNLEQRTKCFLGSQCPSHNVTMLVDWVAEYVPDDPKPPVTTTSISTSSTTPTTPLSSTTTTP